MTDATEVPGATGGEDLSGLRQPGLADRRLRDVAEAELIDRAYQKYVFRSRPRKPDTKWLTPEFLKKVHHEMFGDIWEWAGQYRKENLNLQSWPVW